MATKIQAVKCFFSMANQVARASATQRMVINIGRGIASVWFWFSQYKMENKPKTDRVAMSNLFAFIGQT
jgi:hypothetical protein